MPRPTYEVPVPARLVVKLDNGQEWEAKPGDLNKFGLVNALDAYSAFDDRLRQILEENGMLGADQEITDAALNPLRYFVEIAIMHPNLLQHQEMKETEEEIVAIEQAIRRDQARAAKTDRTDVHPLDVAADALRLHLFTMHHNVRALTMTSAEANEEHLREHAGPGTIRNHPLDSRDWSLRRGLQQIGEIEYGREQGGAEEIIVTMALFHDHIDRLSNTVGTLAPVEAVDQ